MQSRIAASANANKTRGRRWIARGIAVASIGARFKTSSAGSVLEAVIRLRHEYSWKESGNRNFGAEAVERLVEALEMDQTDTPAWVQPALLQMGT